MTSFEMMNLFLSRAQSRHREADEVSSESAFAALTADALENEQHAQVYALASIAESLATIAALLNDSTSEAEGFRYLRTHDIRSLLDED